VSVWVAVVAVGAASLAFRLLPLLAVERFGLRPRTADTLRHAGAGALTALVVLAVLGPSGGRSVDVALLLAVAVGGMLAWRRRPMLLVVVCGVATFAAATGAGTLL
jgi:branched-subunit amino acid transport protein